MASSGNVENNRTKSVEFEHFDVVQDVAKDHHYIASKSYQANATIMKEWKILKKNLPDSIYVQVYEPRIDLLRAVIIGPQTTPYHDGLFFFDIYLPSDYPNEPPKVHYHSHGYHLNPNLYANGYVCLSLINTWSGDTGERWRKGDSSILQLLVSIQGLVLTEKPYFNEPGYGIRKTSLNPKWINDSKSYDENTFLLSCKSMLQIIRKPPVGFSDFIVEHFKQRSVSILAAVKAYKNGDVVVGQFQANGSSSSSVKISTVYKSGLRSIGRDLAKAFQKIQAPKKDTTKHESNFWGTVFCCLK